MTTPEFSWSEDFAIAMDQRDPLRDYRERFLFPKTPNGEDCVYLCGHSLGLQPKTAAEYIQQELKDWAELGVEAHFQAANAWMPYHRLLTNQTAAPCRGQALGSGSDEFAHGKSSPDDGVVLQADAGAT